MCAWLQGYRVTGLQGNPSPTFSGTQYTEGDWPWQRTFTSLDQRLLLLFYANGLHVRIKKESGSEPTRSQHKRSFLLKHGAEEKWRAYQSKLVWCLRGRRTFFLPTERTPITASGSLCLLQVSQPGRATQESCLIVNAPQESWWLFQIAGISFTAVGRKEKTKTTSEAQPLNLVFEEPLFLFSGWDKNAAGKVSSYSGN